MQKIKQHKLAFQLSMNHKQTQSMYLTRFVQYSFKRQLGRATKLVHYKLKVEMNATLDEYHFMQNLQG